MKFCDLHTHSNCSDGTLTPTQLVREAERLGLGAVALCDHNTVAGLPEFLDAARESSVEAIGGIEFSTDYRGGELHLLGLFLEPWHYGPVTKKLEEMLRRKEESNGILVENLRSAGIHLDYAAIKAGTPNGQVNRALIAAEMVRRGYCGSIREAFQRWLNPERGFYQPPKRLDVLEVIRFLESLGVVSVLAHPLLNLDPEQLDSFLGEAVPVGLKGMEVLYATFTQEQRAFLAEKAREFGLAPSGGSDFHGANKPDIFLGRGRGDLEVPMEYLRGLKARGIKMRK